jgi:DNA repair exonuclease SbcCD ATPase subunit
MEGEIEAQENRLLQLREHLKVYHSMKEKYEQLMGEVQSLEAEKRALAELLEKAQTDPTRGCSQAIKAKLQKVEVMHS